MICKRIFLTLLLNLVSIDFLIEKAKELIAKKETELYLRNNGVI